ncbi:hypothetical protein ACLOJK_022898 [Asimina triloba]
MDLIQSSIITDTVPSIFLLSLISLSNHPNDVCFIDGKPSSSIRPIQIAHQLVDAIPTPPKSTPSTSVFCPPSSTVRLHVVCEPLPPPDIAGCDARYDARRRSSARDHHHSPQAPSCRQHAGHRCGRDTITAAHADDRRRMH